MGAEKFTPRAAQTYGRVANPLLFHNGAGPRTPRTKEVPETYEERAARIRKIVDTL